MDSLIIHDGSHPKPSNTIRFVCISDTHSRSFPIPDGDVLIHAGDFTKKGTAQEVWEFANLLKHLPHKHKVVIAGNHDSPFDIAEYHHIINKKRVSAPCDPIATKRLLKNFNYLEDSFIIIEDYKIWGSPWVKQHYKGAFTLKDHNVLKQKFEMIPAGIDILITHQPPYGILDRSKDNISVGSNSLTDVVSAIRPIVHIFGHIHESHGHVMINGITYINASICNNRYQAIFPAAVFDLPKRN